MDDKHQLERLVILIADDNDVVRALLHKYLSHVFPASHILETGNGEEAVYLAVTWEPDVILMNINIPPMNGLEATRRIKTVMPNIRIVIITFIDSDYYRDRASLAGASAYILKNDVVTDLIPVLRNLLSIESRAGNDAALIVKTSEAEG